MKIENIDLGLLEEALNRVELYFDEDWFNFIEKNCVECVLCGNIHIAKIPRDCIGFFCDLCIIDNRKK